jgi:cellulose biosynthesis protein BcsQ
MSIQIISVFNNKGGVGKTTLTFHLAHALAELGKKVLIVDADPQCNLTIYSMSDEKIHEIWRDEDNFIDDFDLARQNVGQDAFQSICGNPRTLHFLLKPAEEGTQDLPRLPPLVKVAHNLDLIPGRLTLHMYEDAIARRWSEAYVGSALALRTLSEIRRLVKAYAAKNGYEIAIVDTSPSLGPLNKVALTMVDSFLVPCAPDLFSLYGIRNIGNTLKRWRDEYSTLYQLIAPQKRREFPEKFVKFLGYTVYNARLRTGATPWNIAIAHYNYASQIKGFVHGFIDRSLSSGLDNSDLDTPIGAQAVMHSHNTYPSQAQKYHVPMWKLPKLGSVEVEDKGTIQLNRDRYFATQGAYSEFAKDVLRRLDKVHHAE